MHPLDANSAVYPTASNTWFPALVKSLLNKAFSFTKKDTRTDGQDDLDIDEDDESSSVTGSESGKSSVQGEKTVRLPTVKAGGKRRKTTMKKR